MRVVFAGTPEFAVPSLRALINLDIEIAGVYTQPDRPAGRGKQVHPGPVKQLAMQHQLCVFQPSTLRDPDEIDKLGNLNPDLLVVTAYGMILPQSVLDLPRLGCINIHASLLPRWRGAAPIQRAIEAGDNLTGVTLMQVEYRLDAGPILAKSSVAIENDETAETLHDKLADLGGRLLAEKLPDIAELSLQAEIQDEAQVTYAEKLSKQEAALDWSRNAAEVDRKIRAMYPWPVATTRLGDTILRVIKASPVAQSIGTASPGEVISSDAGGVLVATGDGSINIEILQKPGGKPLPAGQFLNGMPISHGTILN